MSAIPPALPPAAPPVPSSTAGLAGVISDPSGQLTKLPAGAQIEGTVTATGPGKNVVTLVTSEGSLQIKTPVSVSPGTTLQLQLPTGNDVSQLRLVGVDGQAVSGNGTPLSGGQTADATHPSAAPAASQATSATAVSIGDARDSGDIASVSSPTTQLQTKGVLATVVHGGTPEPAENANLLPLSRGTQFQVRIVAIQATPTNGAPATAAAPTTMPVSGREQPLQGQNTAITGKTTNPAAAAPPPNDGMSQTGSLSQQQQTGSMNGSTTARQAHQAYSRLTPPTVQEVAPPESTPATNGGDPVRLPDTGSKNAPVSSGATAAPEEAPATTGEMARTGGGDTKPANSLPATAGTPLQVSGEAKQPISPPPASAAPTKSQALGNSPASTPPPPPTGSIPATVESRPLPSPPATTLTVQPTEPPPATTADATPTQSTVPQSTPPLSQDTAAETIPPDMSTDVSSSSVTNAAADRNSPPPTTTPAAGTTGSAGTIVPAPATESSSGALPQSFDGFVAPNSHAGQPLIQTSLGLLVLQTDTPLPIGARVTLAPVSGTTMTTPQPPPNDQDEGDLSANFSPAFDDALDILPQLDPHPPALGSAAPPDSGTHWVAALIGLTAAVESGSIRPWFGEKRLAALTKAGQKPQLDRLSKEMSTLKSPVRMPLPGEWQSLILPLPMGQRIERVRLVVRRPPENEKEATAREEEGTRFLLDLDLSKLGSLQLDGLVRRKTKRFDLIFRSRQTLPDGMRKDIAEIFSRSLEGFGLNGNASFQQTAQFIEPIPALDQAQSGWII
ncbi:hypothetical protein [Telmatospirillum sp.]|uniref:hypothetical protein n=1 Tax=Telmatospirillum sp. TaxID=2079197 RepID=UPI00284C3C7A|nr:hypothetical protein [Telmatospirillum sp.]MDR3440774.1 hypothetical protein [Telmatospirillum sp.]